MKYPPIIKIIVKKCSLNHSIALCIFQIKNIPIPIKITQPYGNHARKCWITIMGTFKSTFNLSIKLISYFMNYFEVYSPFGSGNRGGASSW